MATAPPPRVIRGRSLATGPRLSRIVHARPNRVKANRSDACFASEFDPRSLVKCIDAADALGLDDCCLRWVAWRRVRGRCIS